MKRLDWWSIKEIAIFVLGIVLVIFLNNMDNKIEAAERQARIATAGDCRILLALNQPLDEDGPCYRTVIREIWEPLDVEPLNIEVEVTSGE